MDHEHDIRYREPRHHIRLWLALMAGPAAWGLGLTAKYAMVPFACGSLNTIGLHAVSLVTLLMALAGTLLSWRLWTESGREWPDERGSPLVRSRFMSLMGLMAGGLFALAIVAQWVSSAFLNPCMSI
jgi:hypothetical protein